MYVQVFVMCVIISPLGPTKFVLQNAYTSGMGYAVEHLVPTRGREEGSIGAV